MLPIKVLVVDDSAFARKVIREVLSRDPAIEVVGIARDGLEALEKVVELKPDVVTLDLIMPDLDGLGFLRALPKVSDARVVIVSVSGAETELAMEALELGALEIVGKPTALATDRLYELAAELVAKVKIAAVAKGASTASSSPPAPSLAKSTQNFSKFKLVVIGTSTGGPQAISYLFKSLPAGLSAPILIALHIPEGYTAPLAARVSLLGAVQMREAAHGMELRPGEAVIAPGGKHLLVQESAGKFYAVISNEPLDTPHHPSVDVLFESAAKAAAGAVLGVILTGMGHDGLAGARIIKQMGGQILAESASSCVVYGMPRSVIEAGLANEQHPLERMPAAIVEKIYQA